MAKLLPRAPADAVGELLEKLPELKKSRLGEEKYRQLFHFCREIAGLPRFLGTHLGGLVISRLPLTQLTPLQKAAKGVVVTQFDKEAVERLFTAGFFLRTMSGGEPPWWGSGFTEIHSPMKPYMINLSFFSGEPRPRALQSRLGASDLEDLVASPP